ncbi:MAG TPA: UDP-N-acetylmuramoyl-L-alanine--D-glutamate ligase [Bacteroidota bacterium]|nr:UDP-N-acetylmuramoyl-L-alanine--D-glutamate ligase [Bacteroidota bacterium]
MNALQEVDVEEMEVSIVTGKKISVIGAARSGVAAARLLQKHGGIVFVSDTGSESALSSSVSELKALSINYELGKHSDRVLDADILVLSPGVPSNVPVVVEAKRRKMRVVSELEMASWFCHAPILAVTGTNGKTTTTTLIGRMFSDMKRKHRVGGNIGTAFSSFVDELERDSVAVLEVSSFQLDEIDQFHPEASVLLNITPDHLDRYDHDIEKYIASKCRVFENQTMEDVLIYNADDELTRRVINRLGTTRVGLLGFGREQKFEEGAFVDDGILVTVLAGKRTEVVPVEEISIRGLHNLYNSMASTLAAEWFGIRSSSLRATLRNFKGVEHRLEFVREVNGIRFVNDSKATNVDSVWYALQSFKEPLVVLIGGRDKGNDYSRLLPLVARHVKAIVAIGESADKVYEAFHAGTPVVKAGSMEEAVTRAYGLAVAGDVVLLSPACASFDWFTNYEHRGRVFKEIVKSL